MAVYDEDGNYFVASETDFGHPLIISDNVKNETQGRDLISSLAAEWEIVEGLKIRTQLNYNYSTTVQDVYNASNTSQEAHDMNGIAQMNNTLSQDVLSETYITFQRTFADRHNLSVMAGHSFDYNMGRTLSTTAYDFVNDALGNENMGAGNPQKNVINNTYQNSKLLSFYGRLNYVLDDKYLFTFTMRADGSSKFGKNSKWGYFPSGAVSWKLHNEPWMQKLNVSTSSRFVRAGGFRVIRVSRPTRRSTVTVRRNTGLRTNGRRLSVRVMRLAARVPTTAISFGAAFPTPT